MQQFRRASDLESSSIQHRLCPSSGHKSRRVCRGSAFGAANAGAAAQSQNSYLNMQAHTRNLPAQQAAASNQTQQTSQPADKAAGKKGRQVSRHYTAEETAAIAAAWVEQKFVIENVTKSAADKKLAWQMFQEQAYKFAPSLKESFPQLQQLKNKKDTIVKSYEKAISDEARSGGAGASLRDTEWFKILEASDAAKDPLVRPQGLLDKTRPEGTALLSCSKQLLLCRLS